MEKFQPKLLGQAINTLPDSPAEAQLDAFSNAFSKRDYWVKLDFPHFTSLCPVTGQPDFATITIEYIPDEKVVETKSLKFYLQSFRNQPMFNEQVVNKLMDDLVEAASPRKMKITGAFAARGGIALTVTIEYPEV